MSASASPKLSHQSDSRVYASYGAEKQSQAVLTGQTAWLSIEQLLSEGQKSNFGKCEAAQLLPMERPETPVTDGAENQIQGDDPQVYIPKFTFTAKMADVLYFLSICFNSKKEFIYVCSTNQDDTLRPHRKIAEQS